MSDLTERLKTARGAVYYAILSDIYTDIALAVKADVLRRVAAKQRLTMVDVGVLAITYDINLKAMCEILAKLHLIPTRIYDTYVTYGGIKVRDILAAAREQMKQEREEVA